MRSRRAQKKSSYVLEEGVLFLISYVLPFLSHGAVQVCLLSQILGQWFNNACHIPVVNSIIQNDVEFLGIKFKSKKPIPIDTLVTNFSETAYVVSWPCTLRIFSCTNHIPSTHGLLPHIYDGCKYSSRAFSWSQSYWTYLLASLTFSSNVCYGYLPVPKLGATNG